jgi:polysaccharide pyruvyl transferase CsaB
VKRIERSPDTARVGIVGSYGGCNLGDEAILKVIASQLGQSLPIELTVFSHDPSHTLERHGVTRSVALRNITLEEIRREVEGLDLLILGGGGILFDTNAATYLRPVSQAQKLGVPTMVYAIGAGPLQRPIDRRCVRGCLNRAAAVTVRDQPSRQVLESVGVDVPIVVTADPAFLLEPEPLPADALAYEGLAQGRPIVAMSARERGVAATEIHHVDYHALLAESADFAGERYGAQIVFIPMEPRGPDAEHARAVISRMKKAESALVLKGDYSPGEMLSWFDYFSLAIGLRLHFLLFAALRNVPFVALPYAGKVSGFLEHLGLPELRLQSLTAGLLIAEVDRTWDERDAVKARLAAALPSLRERARQTHKISMRLLEHVEIAGEKSQIVL